MKITKESRFKGCLVGLAVGDAVGTTLEFKRPSSFEPITDMVGGGPFGLLPGQWTDDTSMALCLATSLVEKQGFDAKDQMDRYLRWYNDGYMSSTGRCFDIGSTTSASLLKYRRTGNPFAGSTDSRSAGNGSLMRLAPVPMAYCDSCLDKALEMCGLSSKTTHGAKEAVDACVMYGRIIRLAILGEDKGSVLDADMYCDKESMKISDAVGEVVRGSYKRKQPPAIQGTGYVVDAMESALWAFYTTQNFRDGCLAAANLGDDADTTSAIYGQLAGAYYGYDGIPAEWLEKVAARKKIEKLAVSLMRLSEKIAQ